MNREKKLQDLSKDEVEKTINEMKEFTDSTATTNGATNAMTNRATNATTNGATNGTTNGATNGTTNGATNGTANGATNGTTNGATNGTTNGATNGTTNGATNGTANGATNGTTNGATNGTTNGASSQHIPPIRNANGSDQVAPKVACDEEKASNVSTKKNPLPNKPEHWSKLDKQIDAETAGDDYENICKEKSTATHVNTQHSKAAHELLSEKRDTALDEDLKDSAENEKKKGK
jgi:hypothetical protein